MINRIKDRMPNVIGGAADLSPSTKTYMKDEGDFSAENYAGRNMHFGVRELAMTAIGNGIMLHGGLRAFVSTFFVFSDYTKPMARLSSIMGIFQYVSHKLFYFLQKHRKQPSRQTEQDSKKNQIRHRLCVRQ